MKIILLLLALYTIPTDSSSLRGPLKNNGSLRDLLSRNELDQLRELYSMKQLEDIRDATLFSIGLRFHNFYCDMVQNEGTGRFPGQASSTSVFPPEGYTGSHLEGNPHNVFSKIEGELSANVFSQNKWSSVCKKGDGNPCDNLPVKDFVSAQQLTNTEDQTFMKHFTRYKTRFQDEMFVYTVIGGVGDVAPILYVYDTFTQQSITVNPDIHDCAFQFMQKAILDVVSGGDARPWPEEGPTGPAGPPGPPGPPGPAPGPAPAPACKTCGQSCTLDHSSCCDNGCGTCTNIGGDNWECY